MHPNLSLWRSQLVRLAHQPLRCRRANHLRRLGSEILKSRPRSFRRRLFSMDRELAFWVCHCDSDFIVRRPSPKDDALLFHIILFSLPSSSPTLPMRLCHWVFIFTPRLHISLDPMCTYVRHCRPQPVLATFPQRRPRGTLVTSSPSQPAPCSHVLSRILKMPRCLLDTFLGQSVSRVIKPNFDV